MINIDFTAPPEPSWSRHLLDGSNINPTGSSWRFENHHAPPGQYTNAQIDDYQSLRRRDFLWHPPLKLTVRARFSHPSGDLQGTAGFGFWNDPFAMTGGRLPTLPAALWFFYASPQSNMKLDMDTPGAGWKAATLETRTLSALSLAPFAPLAVPLMNIRPIHRAIWPLAQQWLRISESLIQPNMTLWHTYQLDWHADNVEFRVDGETILKTHRSPHGPLGFVMWKDNQAMVATPSGKLGWKTLPIDREEWMEVATLSIEKL